MKTKELLDAFFATQKAKPRINARSTLIDNDKLYNYEFEIGKRFIEMDCKELIDLIDILSNKKNKYNINTMSYSTLNGIVLTMRDVINYYIGLGNPIVNYFTQQDNMSSSNIYRELCKRYDPFTWNYVQAVLDEVHLKTTKERADYYELIVRLFYNGFLRADEIINLTEGMIRNDDKTVIMQDRIIALDDRCYELLTDMKNWNIHADNPRFVWANWNNNYFKYYISKGKYTSFNDRKADKVADTLNGFISRINRTLSNGSKSEENTIVLDTIKAARLGFYDFLVKKYGLDRTNSILTSSRVKQDINDLIQVAQIYGFQDLNPTNIKNNLRPYIR